MPSVVSRIRHRGAGEPQGKLDAPWWKHLSKDFARSAEPFQLSKRQARAVRATSRFDVLLRTTGAFLVGGLALPVGYRRSELRRSMKDLDFYGPMAEAGDPAAFFHDPPSVRVRASKADWFPRFDPEDGVCETLRFDSPFMPVNPRLHKDYLAHKRNRVAHARYWRHNDGPRPTIFAIHGFSADLYLVNEWFFALPWFYRMGCDVMLFTLPFHGERQSRSSPFSGHGFFAGGPSRINESVAQAVMDFRILVDWLKARGVEKIGVTGVSLGGFTSAMLASVEPRLHFAIPNVPVVSIPDLVLEWEPIGTAVRTGLKLLRRDIVDARHLLAVSHPLTYAPVLPNDHLMIVGGVGDRLAPPKHSRLLWEHWDRCPIHWFPGSHLLHLDRGTYLEEIATFLERTDFLPAVPS
ncbi:MAG: alpha/beta hydrolase family protein [Myxococcota bacterium]